jgi:hypothetical protein
MRPLLAVLVAISVALPALAAGWGSYANARFGYVSAVPPGFAAQGEAANGDGQVFAGPAKARLRVWGGFLAGGSFAEQVESEITALKQDGWAITYRATTPGWASVSGTSGGRVVYARAIAGCGDRYAMFELEYGRADMARYNPIVSRLVGSLSQQRC